MPRVIWTAGPDNDVLLSNRIRRIVDVRPVGERTGQGMPMLTGDRSRLGWPEYTASTSFVVALTALERVAARTRCALVGTGVTPMRDQVRLVLADWLMARGWQVMHLTGVGGTGVEHVPGMWGAAPKYDGKVVSYG